MFFLFKKKTGNAKDDILSGLTVALALVPEAVAFAFVAGVDPLVGLYSAFIVGLITSLLGGRPGMISGATGALAVVLVSLVSEHGVEYMFATVVLMGIIQMAFGLLRFGKFARLIPHPVMLGFVNGLAIVIFMAQMGQFKTLDLAGAVEGVQPTLDWLSGSELGVMLGLVALTMATIQFLPKLTHAVPASLAAIVGVTLLSQLDIFGGVEIRTVYDQISDMMTAANPNVDPETISLKGDLPMPHMPEVGLNLHTLVIILPYALILASIGLIESLMTLTLIDEITETRGRGNRECVAQGLANLVTGFFGGMGGCAMIGQSMINVRAGGRGRLSGFTAAMALLAIILVASPLIEMVPLAALVGVMFMVVAGTFEWASFQIFKKAPKQDVFVMVLVTVVTVMTDLAIAVAAGIVVSALVFAWEHAKHISVVVFEETEKYRIYLLEGSLFFGSVASFRESFNPTDGPEVVILDFEGMRVCDHSSLEAIHALAERYKNAGKELHLRHLSRECGELLTSMGDLVDVNVLEDPNYHLALDELA